MSVVIARTARVGSVWDPLYSLTCEDHILLFTDECEDQERSWQGPIREIGSTEPHPSTQNLVAHRSYCYGHASEKSQCPLCNIQLPRWRAGQRGSDRLPPTRRVPGAVPGVGATTPRRRRPRRHHELPPLPPGPRPRPLRPCVTARPRPCGRASLPPTRRAAEPPGGAPAYARTRAREHVNE